MRPRSTAGARPALGVAVQWLRPPHTHPPHLASTPVVERGNAGVLYSHPHHCQTSPVGSLVLSRRGIATSALRHARRMRGGRGRARHREPSPGDWLCQCGETNYRSKRECFKCGAPAPPLPPGVRRPSLPGEDPHDWACACGQMNFRGSVVCHKCAQPKPVPPGQETQLWTCPACKGINRDHRKTCFKCGAISPNFTLAKPQVPGQS